MAPDPAKTGGKLAVTADDPTLAEITRRLVETYQPERIYLFGARARGTAGANSDYDLLVSSPTTSPLPCGEARGPTRPFGGSRRPATSSCGPTPRSLSACTSPRPCRPRWSARGDCSIPGDPVRAADTRAWLARARDDLRGAEIDLAASPPLLGDAAFHCQQAVEKALKVFLAWHDRPFRKTHDLVELGAECVAIDPALEPHLRGTAPLTEYLPGWDVPIASYFAYPDVAAKYEYDFGDGWEHEVTLATIRPRQKGLRYPRCLAGERACPPEDCGGVGGYEDLLAVMRDPTHEEYVSTLRWLGSGRIDPERFNAKTVKFGHPGKRWDLAFGKTAPSRRRGGRRTPRRG
jgi:hypothetical protein